MSLPRTFVRTRWGTPPWWIDFRPAPGQMPEEVDFAVAGGGFTGLAAAACLRQMEPGKTVAVFESSSIGAGSSGHSGGIPLAGTAAGDLPGLGDVLGGFSGILRELAVDCDLTLPGVWELGRTNALPDSPISWSDSGDLRSVHLVPGGGVDPGKLVSGLARAAERFGAQIFENAGLEDIAFEQPLRLRAGGKLVRAHAVLLATNAMALELSGLAGRAEPKFTLAVATESLTAEQLRIAGLQSRKSFYTIDLPYLWGRLLSNDGVVFGGGLVHLRDWRELADLDIASGECARLMARLERRVRGLNPALQSVKLTHRWGGPVLIANQWIPVFARHPRSRHVVVLGGFSGHGVALSVYLGRWAAEVMLGKRELPAWGPA